MKLLVAKSMKYAMGMAAVLFMSSCQREGCPANQFSIDLDVVDILTRTFESLIF